MSKPSFTTLVFLQPKEQKKKKHKTDESKLVMTALRTTPALGEQRSRFIRSADDPGLLAQRITHTIAHTIAHP